MYNNVILYHYYNLEIGSFEGLNYYKLHIKDNSYSELTDWIYNGTLGLWNMAGATAIL